MRNKTNRITLCALLLCIMLILGYIESMLPAVAAVPGIKLGLSNAVLLFAVYMLPTSTAFLLMSMKVLLSGFMFSGVSTMMYGFAGGLVSLSAMVLLSRMGLKKTVVSAVGGVMHNCAQLGLSMIILHMPWNALLLYLAVLVVVGGICGFVTGVCAELVMKHLRSSGVYKNAGGGEKGRGVIAACVCVLLCAGVAVAGYVKSAPQAERVVIWEVEDIK